ncbi:MAG: tyrosine-type recombinase/integrase [Planctomycetota bacterium]|nr:tyrosine-type recombinase/integrase [Planctomycetota bacterium]MDA1177809.1 tyrosine-type recombinase/integrase [Planctomycetota bacterium]
MPHFPKPFFKKSRGLWYVQINGKQVNLGPNSDEAHHRYHQLMLEPRTQTVSDDALVQIVDVFLDWVQKHRSPDTFEWYRYRLQRLCDRYPEMRVRNLRPFHVQEWVDSYPKFTRTSKRNYVRTIKRCLKWATQQGYIDKNPITQLEVPGADRRETTISAEEYTALLSHIRDPDFRDLVIVTWESGCRPQESLRVEARHVELTKQRWIFPISEAKGKRNPRVVYLTDVSLEITRRRMQLYPTGALFRNSRGQPWKTGAVKCAFDRLRIRMYHAQAKSSGETLDEKEVKRIMHRLRTTKRVKGTSMQRTEAEIRQDARRILIWQRASATTARYSLYAIRHSWATRALQSGLDGLTVAILMGHSDPSTLARVYQHLAHQPEHLLSQAKKAVGGETRSAHGS